MSFPVVPGDTVSIRLVLTVVVQTIEVGVMTVGIPPGTLVIHSTINTAPLVIVTIFGGEGHTTMVGQRITCST